MSWLLFLDESGHDHKSMPYEVRGGVALHASELWPFIQQVQRLELASFGTELHQFKMELKGSKLLDKDRFRWAAQGRLLEDEARRSHCRGFLTKGLERKPPSRDEFTAYGQACLENGPGDVWIAPNSQGNAFRRGNTEKHYPTSDNRGGRVSAERSSILA